MLIVYQQIAPKSDVKWRKEISKAAMPTQVLIEMEHLFPSSGRI